MTMRRMPGVGIFGFWEKDVTMVKKLQVLGMGCPKCGMLMENAEAAARGLGIEYELEKVTDIREIMNFGVMMTPALAVDGEVMVVGNVPSVEKLRDFLS